MKSKKITKIIGAGGLAIIMCAGVLCGTLISPMNSTHATTSGATSASNSGDPAAGAQSPDRALKLNPQTDETIFTTETGIEIKSHNLSASGAESSIQYFTLGAYNGTPVNWLIVGTSNQMAENATDAGALINAAAGNGKLVTGATSSDLLENQILCISEYAFNQLAYHLNFSPHATVWHTFTQAGYSPFSQYTDEFSDYYDSYTEPNASQGLLTLDTTLGINGYYGSGSGKIVSNANFSSNYVFSLSSLNYTTFVGNTQYKIPYLFTETSTKVNLFTSDLGMEGYVTDCTSWRNFYTDPTRGWYHAVGNGQAYANLTNCISTTGIVSNLTIANFTGTPADSGGYHNGGAATRYYHFSTTYSAINNPISIAYRPAFVMQL
ncbi:MAG: hypothetical protein ACLRFR_02880 [Clostridia bacterium]